MTQRQAPQGQDYQPDRFEVQIAVALVILYRSEFLGHERSTFAELISLSKDCLDYGRRLEKLTENHRHLTRTPRRKPPRQWSL